MEPSTPANRRFVAGPFYNGVTILLAIVVTMGVSLAIAKHWKTYDWLSKSLGIVFLLNLAIVPLATIVKLRKGEKAKPDILVQTAYINAYIWVMLATMLFTR